MEENRRGNTHKKNTSGGQTHTLRGGKCLHDAHTSNPISDVNETTNRHTSQQRVHIQQRAFRSQEKGPPPQKQQQAAGCTMSPRTKWRKVQGAADAQHHPAHHSPTRATTTTGSNAVYGNTHSQRQQQTTTDTVKQCPECEQQHDATQQAFPMHLQPNTPPPRRLGRQPTTPINRRHTHRTRDGPQTAVTTSCAMTNNSSIHNKKAKEDNAPHTH